MSSLMSNQPLRPFGPRQLLSSFGLASDLDLFARRVETFGADLQIDARLVHGLQRVLQREVAVLEQLQLLVQLLERLFIGKVLAHRSTSSTRAPRRPEPSRIRTRLPASVEVAERITAPDSTSCVML